MKKLYALNVVKEKGEFSLPIIHSHNIVKLKKVIPFIKAWEINPNKNDIKYRTELNVFPYYTITEALLLI